MRYVFWALSAALAGAAVPTTMVQAARVVDYNLDDATVARDAAEQGVPVPPLPSRGSWRVAADIAPAVDHEVIRAGVACSSWTVSNPMSLLLKHDLAAWDRDGTLASSFDQGADLLVRVDKASTVSRCISTGEMKGACITRVSIDGAVTRRDRMAEPFHVEKEETTKSIGACAGLTRGIGLVSRAAVMTLLSELSAPRRETIPAS